MVPVPFSPRNANTSDEFVPITRRARIALGAGKVPNGVIAFSVGPFPDGRIMPERYTRHHVYTG